MPTYVYKFDDGSSVEVAQGILEDSHTQLPHPVTRVMSPVRKAYVGVGTVLRGSGFYRNDARPAPESKPAQKTE
jgi:predicted nucleic acid-binding Zn ribbon protein